MTCGCVLPNLYVGPSPADDDDFRELMELHVTAIVSVQTEDDDSASAIERERVTATAAALKFVHVPVTDFDSLELGRKLPRCVKVVEKLIDSGEVVYLHCTAGMNRSPTVAVAYLHWCLQWPLEKAMEHMGACRRCYPDEEAIRRASELRNRKAP